ACSSFISKPLLLVRSKGITKTFVNPTGLVTESPKNCKSKAMPSIGPSLGRTSAYISPSRRSAGTCSISGGRPSQYPISKRIGDWNQIPTNSLVVYSPDCHAYAQAGTVVSSTSRHPHSGAYGFHDFGTYNLTSISSAGLFKRFSIENTNSTSRFLNGTGTTNRPLG